MQSIDHKMEKFKADVFLASSRAGTELIQKTHQYLFLLNGAAATAMISANNTNLIAPIIFFASGGFCAIISHYLAYFSYIAEAKRCAKYLQLPPEFWGNTERIISGDADVAEETFISKLLIRYEKYCMKAYYNSEIPPLIAVGLSSLAFLGGLIMFAITLE